MSNAPSNPEQPNTPAEPHAQPAPVAAHLSGPETPPGQPVYQMQPGWVVLQQPQLPPPDLDAHLQKMTPTVWVTYVLAAINVLIFLAMIAKGVSPMTPSVADLVAWGGSLQEKNFAGEPWRLFTACFVHLGIVHIAMNTFALVMLGPRVERMVGPWGFLVAYIASGLVGEIVSSAFNPSIVSVGASGAIFGLVGVQMAVLFLQPTSPLQQSMNSAWGWIIAYVVYNLINGFTQPGIDNAAHIGGLIGGGLCGLVLAQPLELASLEQRWLRNAILAVVATIGVGGAYLGAQSMSSDRINWGTKVDAFAQVETKVNDAFNRAYARYQAKEIGDPELAEVVEKECLPPWTKAIAELRGAAPRGDSAEVHRLLLDYGEARQKLWEGFVDATRETDLAKKQAKTASLEKLAEAMVAKANALKAKTGKGGK